MVDKDRSTPDPRRPQQPSHIPPPAQHSPDDEDTQTLSLDELGLTPAKGLPIQPPPASEPTQRIAPPEAPAPKPAVASEPTQRIAPPEAPAPKPAPPASTSKPPATAEATARLEPTPPGIESTARWDEAKIASATDAGAAEGLLAPEPDDELQLPFSLQPDNVNDSTPQVSRASRVRKPASAKVWVLAGTLAGLAVAAAIYFHPWQLDLSPALPARLEPPALPAVDNVAPPTQWRRSGSFYLAKDEINKPWLYDPAEAQAFVSPQSLPADLDWARLALVARPPLESFTRLAWIQPAPDATGTVLLCRDFAFKKADATTPALDVPAAILNWSAALPAGQYPFAPVAADTPDPTVGLLLVVVSDTGELGAWNPQAPADNGPVWRLKLSAPPVGAPVAWLDARGPEARLWLLIPTARTLAIVDGAAGVVSGVVDWPQALDPEPRLALTSIRLGDSGWGWFASNGRLACAWTLALDGKPTIVWHAELPAGLASPGVAPRLLTFPDPDAPGHDQLAITAADGRTVWINRARMSDAAKLAGAGTIDSKISGELVAADLNGDGYWDLAGINASGNIWYRPGPADRQSAGDYLRFGSGVSESLGGEVCWRLTDQALIGEYFNRDGRPQQVSLELPALTGSNLGLLQADRARRQAGI